MSSTVLPSRRRPVLRRRSARLGWAFASPALLVVAAVMIFPIVFSVVMSASNVQVSGDGFHLNGVTGSNYSILFHAPRFWHDLEFTVLYTVCTVAVEMVLERNPELRTRLAVSRGAPRLRAGYVSSVPGLYFTGLPAAASYGPVMRFVCGTEFASPRLAKHLAAAHG